MAGFCTYETKDDSLSIDFKDLKNIKTEPIVVTINDVTTDLNIGMRSK